VSGWTQHQLFAGAAAVLGYQAGEGGFGRIVVSANPGVTGDYLVWYYNASSPFAVVPGKRYHISANVRTNTTGLTPVLGIAWDQNAVGTPGTPNKNDVAPNFALNAYYTRQVQATAPPSARYGYAAIGVRVQTAGALGNVDFDSVSSGEVLHVSEPAQGTIVVETEYEEGWID